MGKKPFFYEVEERRFERRFEKITPKTPNELPWEKRCSGPKTTLSAYTQKQDTYGQTLKIIPFKLADINTELFMVKITCCLEFASK